MKGVPGGIEQASSEDIAALGLNVLAGDIALPCAILKESALSRNEQWMQAFCTRAGVEICPHGKTTMSPELFARQLHNGAWGITAATPHQVRALRSFGIDRIFYANQLMDGPAAQFVIGELQRDPQFEFYCLVDSVANVHALGAATAASTRPLHVLLEIGRQGGRTGVRSRDQALEVAAAVQQHPGLALAGVETYEFVVPARDDEERDRNIVALFEEFAALAQELDRAGLFRGPQVILSAGGSTYFDVAAKSLTAIRLSRPTLPLIRAGCYLTHDYGWMPGYLERMRKRSPVVASIPGRLEDALEIWGQVQSRPESQLALITVGKRDVSYDLRLPQPKLWFRPGVHPRPQEIRDGTEVVSLNDQHGYLKLPENSPLNVGDLIGLGISHPCTTMDKWRAMLIVDDDYDVQGAISTWF
jgi:D-serine dehydratase